MKKYLTHVIWFVIAILAFVGGMYYGKASVTSGFGNGRFAANGAGGTSTRGAFTGGRGGNGGGFVAGTISSIDSQSITIALPNGSSEVVFYSTSTQVIKPTPAFVSDLTAGTNVMIGGTQNADGSLTAQSIQVRTAGETGPGGMRSAGQ